MFAPLYFLFERTHVAVLTHYHLHVLVLVNVEASHYVHRMALAHEADFIARQSLANLFVVEGSSQFNLLQIVHFKDHFLARRFFNAVVDKGV